MECWLPYGDTEVCATIDSRNLLGILEPKEVPSADDPTAEIERALDNPIESERLERIAKPGDNVAIAVDDHTRAAPSHLMLPPILDRLNDAGVDEKNISVLCACGNHRPVRDEEMRSLVGEEVLKRVSVKIHDCHAKDLVHVGKTSFKTDVYINRIFAEADLKILTGDVDLHYYAGYGGGRKSLLPGLSAYSTIQHNHKMLTDPRACTGNLNGNPIHEDMTEGAKLAGVNFILNVVMNAKKEIVEAFAGDLERAFLEAVGLVDQLYKVHVQRRAKVVLVSPGGTPFDIDFFQAVKALENATKVVKRGGVIILVAECTDGHGSDVFCEWMAGCKTLKDAERRLKRQFVLGGHKAYYLLKAAERARIILVSSLPRYYARNVFRLDTSRTVDDALKRTSQIVGRNAKIWVIPEGTTTLPITRSENRNAKDGYENGDKGEEFA